LKNYTFLELREKIVVNICDGRQLGRVCDVEFSCFGKVLGIIVPGCKKFFKNLSSSDSIFIPWNRIVKFGADTVLVELVGVNAGILSTDSPDSPPEC